MIWQKLWQKSASRPVRLKISKCKADGGFEYKAFPNCLIHL
jgi:hypothetical protein